MSLGVLNNISAIYAQNNLANTQASLSKTLQQLSSGSRINSGADDAAGLSLANGLQASATALSQSAKNASEGVDFLQVADGALSQVTSLLNRAVTLATEASNGTLNSSQVGAANSEYQKILTEIDTINNNTEYNGINTFAKNAAYTVGSGTDVVDIGATGGAVGVASEADVTYNGMTLKLLNSGTTGSSSTVGTIAANGTGRYIMQSSDTLSTIAGQINSQFGASVASVQGNQLVLAGGAKLTSTSSNLVDKLQIPTAAAGGTSTLTVGNANDTLTVNTSALNFTPTGGTATAITNFGAAATGNLHQLAAQINTQFAAVGVNATVSGNTMKITGGTISTANNVSESEAVNAKANQSVAIFTSDGTISQSYNNSASDMVQASSSALSLAGTDLTSTAGAQAALSAINSAITTVAASRGTIGANINTLTAVGNVMTTQSTNTLAAENDVTATDYGQATSDMSKYQILSQTGIAALSQANQAQQLITKLLQ
ncbi:flagellin [Occallatibacter savannae]|uniref:flagellin N-terminal helical domain-containing protein n=1 Tax=Occallatibacter savannae TaxID=1002691 RepID=UPI00194E5911|nr:flagellin [Occallatibacter savannae]